MELNTFSGWNFIDILFMKILNHNLKSYLGVASVTHIRLCPQILVIVIGPFTLTQLQSYIGMC